MKLSSTKVLTVDNWLSYDEAVRAWREKYPQSRKNPHIKLVVEDRQKKTRMTGVSS